MSSQNGQCGAPRGQAQAADAKRDQVLAPLHHPISGKNRSRLHQIGPKVLPGIFLGCALHAVKIWKGDILVADIEELEQMDASEINAKRFNAKEVLTPLKVGHFLFPVADGTVDIFLRRSGSENIHLATGQPRPRRRTRKSCRRIRRVFNTFSRLIAG